MKTENKLVKVLLLGVLSTGANGQDWATIRASQKEAQKAFRMRAEELVSTMSLDEKASLFPMQSRAVPRLNIPPHDWWSEALHGVARNGRATQYPQAICIASTWNPDLVLEMGMAIGKEARAKHHAEPGRHGRYQGLTLWSPTINLARDPRWGRSEETYGEDPFLTGRIAVSFVRGVQGRDPTYYQAIATVKHFIANNTEHNRYTASPPIQERTLREYYMQPYRAAVRDANVQSIMTAYNGVGGVPCSANHRLITDVLRGEWGFLGTVVTDVGAPGYLHSRHRYVADAVAGAAAMVKAGVDIASDRKAFDGYVKQAVQDGLITESDLDRAITQNLTTRLQLGQIDPCPDNPFIKIPTSVVGCDAHRRIARTIAQQGMVLLRNRPAQGGREALLPVPAGRYKKIIVTGPYARTAQLGGYSGNPAPAASTPFDGISSRAAGIDVVHEETGQKRNWRPIPSARLRPAGDMDADAGLRAEYFAGVTCEGTPKTVRVDAQIDFSWEKPLENVDPEIPQPQFAVRWTGTLTPEVSGTHRLAGRSDDGMRIWLDGALVVDDWRRRAVNRSESVPVPLKSGQSYDLRVEYFEAGGEAEAHLEWAPPATQRRVVKAADMDSTLIVYAGGFNTHMADEFRDLRDLRMPLDQRDEVAAWLAMCPNVVVVLNGGTIVTEPDLFATVPAVLQAWYPGQEGGDALADLLFGDISPSGRLPVTWYASTNDLPDFEDYEISKGRTYQYFEGKPQFVFGHGLSYTTFDYAGLTLSKSMGSAQDTVTVSLLVRNSGTMDADEVVQIYARHVDSPVRQPLKKLVGFQRVTIPKGEQRQVSVVVPMERLAHWDEASKRFVVKPGAFSIMAGSSSGDIRVGAACMVDEQGHILPQVTR